MKGYFAVEMSIRTFIHVVACPLVEAVGFNGFTLIFIELFTVERIAGAYLEKAICLFAHNIT
jgi:hypothetical protein